MFFKNCPYRCLWLRNGKYLMVHYLSAFQICKVLEVHICYFCHNTLQIIRYPVVQTLQEPGIRSKKSQTEFLDGKEAGMI